MDKYISDIVQVYLSIFYFLIMLSNELISGTVLKKAYRSFCRLFWYCPIKVCKPIFLLSLYLKLLLSGKPFPHNKS